MGQGQPWRAWVPPPPLSLPILVLFPFLHGESGLGQGWNFGATLLSRPCCHKSVGQASWYGSPRCYWQPPLRLVLPPSSPMVLLAQASALYPSWAPEAIPPALLSTPTPCLNTLKRSLLIVPLPFLYPSVAPYSSLDEDPVLLVAHKAPIVNLPIPSQGHTDHLLPSPP